MKLKFLMGALDHISPSQKLILTTDKFHVLFYISFCSWLTKRDHLYCRSSSDKVETTLAIQNIHKENIINLFNCKSLPCLLKTLLLQTTKNFKSTSPAILELISGISRTWRQNIIFRTNMTNHHPWRKWSFIRHHSFWDCFSILKRKK